METHSILHFGELENYLPLGVCCITNHRFHSGLSRSVCWAFVLRLHATSLSLHSLLIFESGVGNGHPPSWNSRLGIYQFPLTREPDPAGITNKNSMLEGSSSARL